MVFHQEAKNKLKKWQHTFPIHVTPDTMQIFFILVCNINSAAMYSNHYYMTVHVHPLRYTF